MVQLPSELRVGEAPGGSAGSGASAASDPRTAIPAEVFLRLDENNDGHLGKQEGKASRAVTASWDALDRNGDGRVSRVEFMRDFAM